MFLCREENFKICFELSSAPGKFQHEHKYVTSSMLTTTLLKVLYFPGFPSRYQHFKPSQGTLCAHSPHPTPSRCHQSSGSLNWTYYFRKLPFFGWNSEQLAIILLTAWCIQNRRPLLYPKKNLKSSPFFIQGIGLRPVYQYNSRQ